MSHSNLPSASAEIPPHKKIFTRGTLQYTRAGLWMLFTWLMWNDICVMLMESAPGLTGFLLKDHGASNKEIAFFTTTITGIFTMWINPVFSTWSDRTRTRMGRRKPFLYFATPFTALFLGAIPFMPDLVKFLSKIPWIAPYLGGGFGVILFIGLCYLCFAIFNSIILAIFSYLYFDVVPEEVLGRFNALTRIAGIGVNFIWNYFIFGLAENHMKWVFFWTAVFYVCAYTISLWNIKEGEYPPPPKDEKKGFLHVISSYFSDCFKPYYLWFIGGNAIFQIGNASNQFQAFYFRYDLHLSLEQIGKTISVANIFVMAVVYPMGSLIDRLKPGRVLFTALICFACNSLCAFFFLKDIHTLMFFTATSQIIVSVFAISLGVFTVEFFPREKLGQFCSANAMTYNIASGLIASFFVGILFDWLKEYRYAYLWSTVFYFTAVPLFVKCYLNWCKKQKEELAATQPAA